MVIYFTSNVVTPPRTIYMGVDKFENEDLIRWGWPEDVWFHVDKVSSAHVYLRLNKGETLDDVPTAVIDDCVQLVKANSITGNKMNNLDVVYTMWSNLLKTPKMDVGQVGFVNQREVRKVRVETRINHIVNRLEKTKVAKQVDLRAERERRDMEEREDKKATLREIKQREKEEQKRREELEKLKSYENVMKPENMKTNKDCDSDASDDFM